MQPDKKSYFAIRTPQLCGIALTTEKRRRGAKTVRWTVLAWGTLAGGSPVRSTNATIFREERFFFLLFRNLACPLKSVLRKDDGDHFVDTENHIQSTNLFITSFGETPCVQSFSKVPSMMRRRVCLSSALPSQDAETADQRESFCRAVNA